MVGYRIERRFCRDGGFYHSTKEIDAKRIIREEAK